ncbi:MAG: DUF262 domain-containing protein [Candidatus Acidiferrales bacterium]
MDEIKPNQKLYDVVEAIRDGKLLLPSIQRSFVWAPDRICKLMDSLMSDYPIGSVLLWRPPSSLEIRTKEFAKDFVSGRRQVSLDRLLKPAPYLVLDGQQRLQSLFLSFFGSYDGKHLYFKVDSDPSKEQDGLKYQFEFRKPDSAELESPWLLVREAATVQIPKISSFVNLRFSKFAGDVKERIISNLLKFIQVFKIDDKLAIQNVQQELPYEDVLEVFVRVNSGGMVLTKSDLVFSTIVLHAPEMEKKFIELVDQLNGGGEYDFDTDFIIKSSFIVLGQGAKYDVEKLRDRKYVNALENRFSELERAVVSAKEFLKTSAKLLSKRFLKSDLALIPVIDFLFNQPHQQLPEGQSKRLRQYLYMSFFMKFYSYGPDGKLDVIHRMAKGSESKFPRREIGSYMEERTGIKYDFHLGLAGNDLDLVLNIIEDGVSEIPKLRGWSLEKDHIFPRSVLSAKGIPESLTDRVGNFRLINKTRNIEKSKSIPAEDAEFFGSDDVELKKLYLQARKSLTADTIERFVVRREDLIAEKVKGFLRF